MPSSQIEPSRVNKLVVIMMGGESLYLFKSCRNLHVFFFIQKSHVGMHKAPLVLPVVSHAVQVFPYFAQ